MDDYIPQNNINILIESLTPTLENKDLLSQLINLFEPISLAEMDSVRLMNRVDTKFLIGYNQLDGLLKNALEHYRIVEIDGKRIISYSTIYFDTDDAEMYMMHHNGKLNRYKIRMRSYLDSGVSFFEIKNKNNKGRTTKKRIEITAHQFKMMELNENEHLFIRNTFFRSFSLKPQLQNTFRRITLVDKSLTERVTLDLRLSYQNLSVGLSKSVDGLVIIEMKQDGANRSYFKDYLNELRVTSGSMSKYCLGMVLLNEDLKNNRFKRKLRKINKITENNNGAI